MTVWVKGVVTFMSDYDYNCQVTDSPLILTVEVSDMLMVLLQADFANSSFLNRPGYWELELGGREAFLGTD